MRGGVPRQSISQKAMVKFSPHAWGCSVHDASRLILIRSFPHMRGGVPGCYAVKCPFRRFSPHAWGCSVYTLYCDCIFLVFPTCVGVFRREQTRTDDGKCFPHMRGGVPFMNEEKNHASHVFPTCVGVFRHRLRLIRYMPSFSPHAWGCSDEEMERLHAIITFSPHAWGCSGRLTYASIYHIVFPTCVGVFRKYDGDLRERNRFPHMRGGVPTRAYASKSSAPFSPHAWGCSVLI